ncbi:hypothetical protein C8R46DRAFT_1226709 [Mycena filopes]|nr:hypothetical protein C8R46DRAFT_1226709 [Mycena filopes]
MHFIRFILSVTALAASANAIPQSTGGGLAKRYCGFEFSCPCTFNPQTGCTPQFDECEQLFYWPPACATCGDCVQHCLDPMKCAPKPTTQ